MNTIFGTDGIRGKIGHAFFTQEDLFILGRALAQWAQEKYNKQQPSILLLHDTRASYSWVKATLKTGLFSHPVTVYDAHILPTPAALVLMQEYNFLAMIDCAFIITASHNPYHDNGIKILDHTGKLSATDEAIITSYATKKDSQNIDYRELGREIIFDNADKLYCAKIIHQFPHDFLRGLTIVLDCANGATYRTAPAIFKALGAHVIAINNAPSGYNINEKCGSTAPAMLQKIVLSESADFGFAFDGDGDRVIAVNQAGEIKNGDDILALLSHHPAYKKESRIIGTTVSNKGLEDFLTNENRTLIRTDVGDKHVLAAMDEHNALLGAEPSGHCIMNDVIGTSDGVATALRVLESVLLAKNMPMTTFNRYPQTTINLAVHKTVSLDVDPLATIIQEAQKKLEKGRIVVRYSQTEPLLRIMVEANSNEASKKNAESLAEQISKAVHSIKNHHNSERDVYEKTNTTPQNI